MSVRLLVRSATTLLILWTGIAVAQTSVSQESRHETYQSATLDANGNLSIVTANGRTVTVRIEDDQTSFSEPVLSSSTTAVGALAMFPNCCTSYDIPLQLIVYFAGKVHRFTGVNLSIFLWAFADSGTRVAYGQEPVHFSCGTHYEFRDIGSERLIDAVDIPKPCGHIPDPKPVRIPSWVADLISKKQAG